MSYFLLDNRNPLENYYTTRRMPILATVVHVTAGLQGLAIRADSSAEQVSRYASTTDRQVSWHSGSDTDSHLELLPDSYTAFHCQGYNSCTIGHEISKTDVLWADEDPAWVTETLDQAAACLKARALAHKIPLRHATKAELDAAIAHWKLTGEAKPVGFVDHSRLDPTRRKDPGEDFPWMRFFNRMASPPPPVPTPSGEPMSPEQWQQWKTANDGLRRDVREVAAFMNKIAKQVGMSEQLTIAKPTTINGEIES